MCKKLGGRRLVQVMDLWVAGLTSVGLLVYLIYALLKPEEF